MEIKNSIREPMAPGNTLEEKFTRLAEIGIAGIEITKSSTEEYAEEIRKAAGKSGVRPNIFSAAEMGLLDARPDERERATKNLKDALTLCSQLGGIGVIFPPLIDIKMRGGQRIPDLSPAHSTEELETTLLTEILKTEIAPHAEKCGCSLIIEPLNRYEQWWPCTIAHGVEICQAVGSPGIKTMADLFHMNIEDADLAESIRYGANYIANVHLADSNRVLPGYGHTEFEAPLRALGEIGYDKYCGFECKIPAGSDPAVELKKSMAYLNAQL